MDTMKKYTWLFIFLLRAQLSFAQNFEYFALVKEADLLYDAKDYKNSASVYSKAFKSFGWKGEISDRYNAACSWALANNIDSAFLQLHKISTIANYSNHAHITQDPDLNALHKDGRWKPLLEIILQNKEKAEAHYDKPLIAQLDSIYREDQKYRQQIEPIEKKFGWKSNEMKALWKIMREKDSVNLLKVKAILKQNGWLGTDVVGEHGSTTLFLVIQHADQITQEKYLPMMREAVENKKAKGRELALLEDRVALRQGKKQIYGSQIGRDIETNHYYVLPLEDPENVDTRRSKVGLEPLALYAMNWQIKWDVEQYKKDLPEIEAKEKRRGK